MKKFLNALCAFFAFVGGLFLFFRFKKQETKPNSDVEKMDLKIKLKEIEAQNEVEQLFKDKSDRDIVIDAINAESSKRKS